MVIALSTLVVACKQTTAATEKAPPDLKSKLVPAPTASDKTQTGQSIPSAQKPEPTPKPEAEPREKADTVEFAPVPTDFGVAINEDLSQAALARGRALAQKGDWKKAFSEFELAVAFNALDATARGELGFAGQHIGETGVDLLRTAETMAKSDSVRGAIVFNLASAYEAKDMPEHARRAKNRALALKGAHDQPPNDTCPVVAQVSEARNLELRTWLDLYAWVVQDQESQWNFGPQGPPKTEETARNWLCKSEPDQCQVGRLLQFHTNYGAENLTHHIWPLADGRVAHMMDGRVGITGQACEADLGPAALVHENFLMFKHSVAYGFKPFLEKRPFPQPELASFNSCDAKLSISHDLSLVDAELGREFRFSGLGSDVSLKPHPKEHAVSIIGRFCDMRISLEDCKTGVCTSW